MVLKFFLFAFLFLLISCTGFERDNPDDPDGTTFQPNVVYGEPVSYMREIYQTVVIGNQVWMARNLNYNASGSKCYENKDANCAIYGRLYDWATAMNLSSSCNSISCSSQIEAKHKGICPSGWHIPNNADWDELYNYVGTKSKYLKATSGWNGGGNGYDRYGFSALPGGNGGGEGGYGGSYGSFYNVGDYGWWWSSSESDKNEAYIRYIFNEYEGASYGDWWKVCLLSVRCVKD